MRSEGWHVRRWPPLAWLETLIKLAGMVYGLSALGRALQGTTYAVPAGSSLVQFVVLVILSLGLVAAIWNRISDREIIAMVFVILNNFAHWGLVVGMLAGITDGVMPFAGLFLVGDLVKLVFIRVNRFRVQGASAGVLYALTGVYVVGYLAILTAGWLGG